MVNAPPCHGGDYGFDPRPSRFFFCRSVIMLSGLLLVVMCVVGYKLDKMDEKLNKIIKEFHSDNWSIK